MGAMTEPRLRVLSLGVGVQSVTLALMAARGDIGCMPDCAGSRKGSEEAAPAKRSRSKKS